MTKLVGIINITPDSFSDGGLYLNNISAIKQAEKLISDGADILDIGAESTRPNADIITAKEEWKRLKPVLKSLQKFRNKTMLSVDTRNFYTAKKSIEIGVDWINDVSGFTNQNMINTVKNSNVKLVVMHNLGVPADKNITINNDSNCVDIVYLWAKDRISHLTSQNISISRIIFDVGIGFGKNSKQSIYLINNIERFKTLGVKLLVGHSRKSFLDIIEVENPPKNINLADYKTNIISKRLVEKKITYLRLHNLLDY